MWAPGWLFSPPTNPSIHEIWYVWLKNRQEKSETDEKRKWKWEWRASTTESFEVVLVSQFGLITENAFEKGKGDLNHLIPTLIPNFACTLILNPWNTPFLLTFWLRELPICVRVTWHNDRTFYLLRLWHWNNQEGKDCYVLNLPFVNKVTNTGWF